MPYATLDGIKTHYVTQGSGPHLLMMAPRGFNSRIESWKMGKWGEMDAFKELSKHFTIVAYDRRESGLSGGRVEVLTWSAFARHAKLLLEHLKVEKAWVIGPCMGVAVAAQFGVQYPDSTVALMLPQPVGGHKWFMRLRSFFDRHIDFVRQNGLEAVKARALASEGKNFQDDPEAGPWSTPIFNDANFATRYGQQSVPRYLEIVAASRDAMFPSSFVSGPDAEDLMQVDLPCLVWPGDDPSHATSAAHQLRELLPRVHYWDLHVSQQTWQGQLETLLKFKKDVENGAVQRKPPDAPRH
jgi:pimeloyl-ACP methyl ester carboxylesterase